MPDDKVTFTAEQQEKINEIVRERMGAAGREARTEAARLADELKALQQRIADSGIPVEAAPPNGSDDGGTPPAPPVVIAPPPDNTELETLRSELASVKQQKQQDSARFALESAAKELGAIDAEVVCQLLQHSVKPDEHGHLQVVSETGTPMLSESFEPLSIKELVQRFLNQRPYLQRGVVKGGVGSSESMRPHYQPPVKVDSIFGPKASGVAAMKLKKENPAEYARLKRVAVEQGLLR